MRTDGLFRTQKVKINYPIGKPLSLIPFGDIHHDSPAFSRDAWDKFIKYAKSNKDALFLGMGDYFDGYSTSERVIIYNHNLHESSKKRHEEEQIGRIKRLAKELEFMRGRIIGLLGGNHFSQFSDGTTSDMRLAEMLGCKYLGACAAIRFVMCANGVSQKACIDIFAHHGKGGGATAGGKFNAVEKLTNVCDADIYLMGDNHARGCFPLGDRLFLHDSGNSGLQVKAKQRWVGRTGSFLRAYVENEANYVVDAALAPSNLGWIEFMLTLSRDQSIKEDGKRGSIVRIEIGAKQ